MKHHLESSVDDEEPVERQRFKPVSDEERLHLFQQWIQAHDVIWEHVDIRLSSLAQGFALYSTSSEEAPNIQIPVSLLMSHQSAKDSVTFTMPSSDRLDQTDEHIDRETLILSLFLLHERSKGADSHWFAYIQLLPETFSTPLFSKENYLENTSVFYLAQAMHQSMEEVYNLVGSSASSLEAFLWAYSVVSSRAFKLQDLGTTLIPMADLANHVPLAKEANLRTQGIDKTTGRFVLTTTEMSISKGEELSIKYNELANWQLVLFYGFAIPDNPLDSIALELQIDPEDSYEMEMKKILLFNLNEDLSLEYDLRWTDHGPIISEELLASLRLLVMTNEELEGYTVSNIDQLLTSSVNTDNERRSLNKLLKMLNQLTEASYTTTLEENLDRLKSNHLNDDERYSLIYLIGQKRIIDSACHWIHNALSQLPATNALQKLPAVSNTI